MKYEPRVIIKYHQKGEKHKWSITKDFYYEGPIVRIEPFNNLCKNRNVRICPLYRKINEEKEK